MEFEIELLIVIWISVNQQTSIVNFQDQLLVRSCVCVGKSVTVPDNRASPYLVLDTNFSIFDKEITRQRLGTTMRQ